MFPCRGGRHFGEAAAQCERMCDSCARGGTAAVDRRNVSGAAAGVARTLADWASAEKRATLLQLVDAWRGSKARLAKKPSSIKKRLLTPRAPFMVKFCLVGGGLLSTVQVDGILT